jgi:TRAP-type C4-dicarboxylate transport system permease small subunit
MKNGAAFSSFLPKFEKCTHRLSLGFQWIGLAGGLVIMFITFVDVIAAKVFVNPVPGSIDIVMLSQVVAIAFVAPLTQIAGHHIRLEFFITWLPRRLQAIINSMVYLLLIVLFIFIIWRLYAYGNSLRASGQVSSAAGIPLYPFAYGASIAMLVVCLTNILGFIKSFVEAAKR